MYKVVCGIILIVGVISSCERKDEESERSQTVRLLAGDSEKAWQIHQTFTDGIEKSISFCDSSFVLTMRTDFTWNEIFSYLQCYKNTDGVWVLNDENNVITIKYLNPVSWEEEEKKFVIIELSEDFFMYEFVQNNTIRQIMMNPVDD